MKVYISADIEGVAGIAHWDEATLGHSAYTQFREKMTEDVAAACRAALEAGATEILVKDAHGSGRNIVHDALPEEARLIRNWSDHPFCMLQELDDSFDAALMVGYHAAASVATTPLSHTLSLRFPKILLNGQVMSEFMMHSYIADYVGVPVVMISGDGGICRAAEQFNPSITTVTTGEGVGASNIGLHPELARRKIAEGVNTALSGDLNACRLETPARFVIEIWFNNHALAYQASFYPGARAIGAEAVGFEADNFFDIARMIRFMP